MSRVVRLAVIPGDGIGPEVIAEAVKVLDAAVAATARCGADGTAMGFGCTDLGDAMFRMIAGEGVPAAQTCDGMTL